MDFHQLVTVVSMETFTRKDIEIGMETEALVSRYVKELKESNTNITIQYKDMSLVSLISKKSKYGPAILYFYVPDTLGINLLMLPNDHIQGQKYAIKFMHMIAGACMNTKAKWRLPIPPLEIARRPLFYYVVYRMAGAATGEEWDSLANTAISRANAAGIALLRTNKAGKL
jgi:hypothetical protein